jgi:hypothetical protein
MLTGCDLFLFACSWVMPVMVTFTTFAVHAAIEDTPMEPSQAFTVVALMMMLRCGRVGGGGLATQ